MCGNTSFLATEHVDKTLASFVRIANLPGGLEKIGFATEKPRNNHMATFCCFLSVYEDVFSFHSGAALLIAELITSLTNRKESIIQLRSEIERIAGDDGTAVFILHNSWGSSINDAFWKVASVRYDTQTNKFVDSEKMINPLNLYPHTSSRSVVHADAPLTMVESHMNEFKSKFHGVCIDVSHRILTTAATVDENDELTASKQLATYRPLLASLRTELARCKAELQREVETREEAVEREKHELVNQHNKVVEQLVADCHEADEMRTHALAAQTKLKDECDTLTAELERLPNAEKLSEQISVMAGKMLLLEEELKLTKQKTMAAQRNLEVTKKSCRESESRREAEARETEQARAEAATLREKVASTKKQASEHLADLLEARQRFEAQLHTQQHFISKQWESEEKLVKALAFRLLFVEAARRRATSHSRKLERRVANTTSSVETERQKHAQGTSELKAAIDLLNAKNKRLTSENGDLIAQNNAHVESKKELVAELALANDKICDLEVEKANAKTAVNESSETGGTVEEAKSITPEKEEKKFYPAQAVASAKACIAQLERFVDAAVNERVSQDAGPRGPQASHAPVNSQSSNHSHHHSNHAQQAQYMYGSTNQGGPPPYFQHPPMLFYPNPNDVHHQQWHH